MKIAFDLDGVLYDFRECSRKACADYYGDQFDVTAPGALYDYWEEWGMRADEFWTAIRNTPTVFNSQDVDPAWIDVLQRLKDNGHTLIVVTARSLHRHNTIHWLDEQGLINYFDAIHFAKDKLSVDFDIIIEDSPHVIEEIAAERPVIVWNQPWNNDTLEGEVYRMFTHNGVLTTIANYDLYSKLQVIDDLLPCSVLEEAQQLIHGERNADYGHPLDDFTKTAGMLTALFGDHLEDGFEFQAEHVPLIMNAVKMSREMNRSKRDNAVDGAGYWGTLQMVKEERERRAMA